MLAALTERELAAKQRGVAGVAYPMGYETLRLRDTLWNRNMPVTLTLIGRPR